jgi:hypothetical protein
METLTEVEHPGKKVKIESPLEGDVILNIEGTPVSASRFVLASWSDVFRRMFETNMKEGFNKFVNLPEEKLESFQLLLSKINPPQVLLEANAENVETLLYYADKYQMPLIHSVCLKYVVDYST